MGFFDFLKRFENNDVCPECGEQHDEMTACGDITDIDVEEMELSYEAINPTEVIDGYFEFLMEHAINEDEIHQALQGLFNEAYMHGVKTTIVADIEAKMSTLNSLQNDTEE